MPISFGIGFAQNKRAKMDPDKAVTSLDLQRQQAAARAADRTGDAAADGGATKAAAPADDSRQHGAGPPPSQQPLALSLNIAGEGRLQAANVTEMLDCSNNPVPKPGMLAG